MTEFVETPEEVVPPEAPEASVGESMPAPAAEPEVREGYFVWKRARAGDLDPDEEVWLKPDLPNAVAPGTHPAMEARAHEEGLDEIHLGGFPARYWREKTYKKRVLTSYE